VARRAPPRAALVPANNGRDFSEPDPPLPDDMRYSPAEPASTEPEPPPEASTDHSEPAAEDATAPTEAEEQREAEAEEQQHEAPDRPQHRPQPADDTDSPPRP
jgi:hypothetical protein